MNLNFFQGLISPVIDLWIFYQISTISFYKKDIFFSILFIVISSVLGIYVETSDFLVGIIQAILIFLYFFVVRRQKIKYIFSSIIIFELIDLILGILTTIVELSIPSYNLNARLVMIIGEIFIIFFIRKVRLKLKKMIIDSNSRIFIGLIFYIYLATAIIYSFVLKDDDLSEVLFLSFSLLILQIIFSIFVYLAGIHVQKDLLTKKEQEKQKLKLQLIQANQIAVETEYLKLLEYTNYLDKNEDELRRFKHDYQNMLNGLKISAQEGNTKEVIEQLDKYTNSQFDQKALRKYKGVNHIHEKSLKSIAIAKLTKLYNLNINYSFGCDKDIYQIPKSVDILDLVRIIGITFDNAIEESQALIKETGKQDSAQVDAMYYQEDGDFEFEIRNRVRNKNFDTDKISQKNYTTKKNHMGLGLSNVQQIAHKYESTMMVNYMVDKGWFTFDLTILPDEKEKSTN